MSGTSPTSTWPSGPCPGTSRPRPKGCWVSPEQKHARKPRPLKAGQTRGMLPESSHSGSGFARADEKARFRFPGSSACCSVAGPHAFQVPLASPLRLAPRKVGLHGSVLHPRKKTSHNQEIRRGHPEDFCLRAGSSPRSSGQELYCLARHAQDSEDQVGGTHGGRARLPATSSFPGTCSMSGTTCLISSLNCLARSSWWTPSPPSRRKATPWQAWCLRRFRSKPGHHERCARANQPSDS